MAWTEQDYQEIVARLMAESIGVNEVPDAGSTDDISSLPAYQPANGTEVPTVVKASLELLVAPALDAADKANEAADKAENNATAAQTAANTANEKAELAAQAASDANAAKEEAEAATQSANNAASNAEEKAEAANTAAQDAEKVANNPTYIGTDHYVYVYNKETDSFDKTGIYCKGEPGSSFRVAGEYATLEALKSAVPDGSAVDGFMAVGTEAPYDYYAWVNGDWVNQGKIAGGGSGNVVVIPAATTALSDQSTSEEIFEAFGGKQSLIDIIKEIKSTEDCIVVASDNDINSASKIVYSSVSAVYTDDNNMALSLIAWTVNITTQMVIKIVNGVASCALNTTPLMTEAPSNGNVYGRKNKDWVEVPEHLNLTSEDLNDINGAGFATQKSIADYTSPENNYPINENGALIFANANYGRSNQIYGSYLTNRWFARGGGNQHGVRTNWKEFAFTDDVLTKTNTSSFTPTQPYHPATKKYVDNIGYGKVIDVDSGTISNDLFGKGLNLTGVDAEERVNRYFGNLSNFRSVVQDIIENHTRYFIHNGNDCRELGCLNTWKNTGNTEHELHFILTGFSDGNLQTKRYSIRITENTDDARFIIVNIISSDNLTTITKKTAAEYEALGSKDANTAYCVTD